MRWTPLIIVGLALSGCKNGKVEGVIDVVEAPPVSVLGCPESTIEIGALPPERLDYYCALPTASGRFLKHGPSWSFHANGNPKEYGTYANDVRSGRWWFWHEDGTLKREGDFSKGEEAGYWLLYGTDGSVSAEGPKEGGGRHGTWSALDEATGVPNEGSWVYGERDGTWVEYNAAGTPQRERVYRRGRLISQREL